jgi:hypothetical protein
VPAVRRFLHAIVPRPTSALGQVVTESDSFLASVGEPPPSC